MSTKYVDTTMERLLKMKKNYDTMEKEILTMIKEIKNGDYFSFPDLSKFLQTIKL